MYCLLYLFTIPHHPLHGFVVQLLLYQAVMFPIRILSIVVVYLSQLCMPFLIFYCHHLDSLVCMCVDQTRL